MFYEDYDTAGTQERNGDDVYSIPVRAGKRTYFFDVKETKNNDFYLTITESKRRTEKDGRYVYEKHKIFLYKEDFEKFTEGLEEVKNYVKARVPVVESRNYDDRTAISDVVVDSVEPENEDGSHLKSFSDINFDEL